VYKSDSSLTSDGTRDRFREQRSVCSLKGVCVLRSPIVDLLERVKVGKAFEDIFSAATLVLWIVVRLFRWQVVSQTVSDWTQDVFPAHSHKIRWVDHKCLLRSPSAKVFIVCSYTRIQYLLGTRVHRLSIMNISTLLGLVTIYEHFCIFGS
jgi:hypothetical protein